MIYYGACLLDERPKIHHLCSMLIKESHMGLEQHKDERIMNY